MRRFPPACEGAAEDLMPAEPTSPMAGTGAPSHPHRNPAPRLSGGRPSLLSSPSGSSVCEAFCQPGYVCWTGVRAGQRHCPPPPERTCTASSCPRHCGRPSQYVRPHRVRDARPCTCAGIQGTLALTHPVFSRQTHYLRYHRSQDRTSLCVDLLAVSVGAIFP